MADSTFNAVRTDTKLETPDLVVVVIYFVAVIAVGIYASCRASKGTVSGYFLAGRSMIWFTVGSSLFVSNIGSEHFIGLAGSGAAGGIGVGAWEFNAILLLQLLGFVFIPVYIAGKIYTMPEYLSKRFGGSRLRVYFALLSLVLYIFTKCSVDLYTGALFIQQSLGWDLYLSIFILIVVVAILTITGGLTAVIYTDTLQASLMVIGALALTGMGFQRVGGFDGLWRSYPNATTNETIPNTTCHETNKNWNIMLRDANDDEMPWAGFLFGQTPGSIWYWCSDQVIVQRALAAKSLSHAQGATIMAALIKILPLFIMVMPGMISRVLFPREVACVDPDICWEFCQSRAGCTNIAYPKLVLGIMPVGARGLMMAVMIAALMSDLDSIFNSASTLFTIDIWKRIRKRCTIREQMIVGRVFIIVMTGVAIAWVPVVKETQGGQVFIYIQEITNYLAPPIACVFLLAILWPRCNERGAFWGLMVALAAGLTRLILIYVYPAPGSCGEEDHRPSIIKDVHYMYFAMLLFWLTFFVTVIVSLATDPPEPVRLLRLTFWSRYDTRSVEAVMKGYKFNGVDQGVQTHDNLALEAGDEGPELNGDKVEEKTENGVFSVSGEMDKTNQEQITQGAEKMTFKDKFMQWLCGFSEHGSNNEEAERLAKLRETKISSLKQDPLAKFVLYILMVVVLLLGTFLYIFWSLWRYDPDA